MKKMFKYLMWHLLAVGYLSAQAQQLAPGTPDRSFLAGTGFLKGGDIFGTRVFVENKGQFDAVIGIERPVLYALDNGPEKIYFTGKGLVYLMSPAIVLSDADLENKEHRKELRRLTALKYFVSMQWIGASAQHATVEAFDRQGHYITYGGAGENAAAFKKLRYRNVYPGIDVEYTIPSGKAQGIKYSFILSPGADPAKIKIRYTGDRGAVSLSDSGQVVVNTPAGDITEHRPFSCDGQGREVPSAFSLNGDTISFVFPKGYDSKQTLVIDPWVTSTTAFGTVNHGYDVDYDFLGNTFVYGGLSPTKVAKYNNAGTLLWCFSGFLSGIGWSSQPSSWIGNFGVDRVSGKCFVGQGVASLGSRIVRLDVNGNYDNFITTATINYQEIWDMGFHCVTQKLFTLGGGHNTNTSAATINTLTAGLNLSTFQPGNTGAQQDIASHCIDEQGNIFVVYSTNGNPALSNKLCRVNTAFNGNVWTQPTTFTTLTEAANKPYNGGWSLLSNGFNCLAVNQNYLYYYDGLNLAAYSKSTGLLLGSTTVSLQTAKKQGGIAVDDCDVLYLGGNNVVLTYKYTGLNFVALGAVSLSLTGTNREVFDIKLEKAQKKLFLSGSGFVGQIQAAASNTCAAIAGACSYTLPLILFTIKSACSSANSGTAVVSGGLGPYSYTWMPGGQTGSVASGLQFGTYTVTVKDQANDSVYHTTVTFPPLSVITGSLSCTAMLACNATADGTAAILNISGGTDAYGYLWTSGLTAQTGALATGLGAGNHSLTVTDLNTGCTLSKTFTIAAPPPLLLTGGPLSATICTGASLILWANASGGTPHNNQAAYGYQWQNGPAAATFTTTQLTAGAHHYSVWALDANGCEAHAALTVTFIATPQIKVQDVVICPLETATLVASGAGTYTWGNGAQGNVFTASPVASQLYTLTGSANGCDATAGASIVVLPAPTPVIGSNSPLCEGESLLLDAAGGEKYLITGPLGFTAGSKSATIHLAVPQQSGIYTVSVTALNSCTAAASTSAIIHTTAFLSASGDNVCRFRDPLLTAWGASTYTWFSGGTSIGNQSMIKPGASLVPGLTTFSVVGTSVNQCTAAAVVSVVTHPLPVSVISLLSPATICFNDTFKLNAGGAVHYEWHGPAGIVFTGQKISFAANTMDYAGTYTLAGFNAYGCAGTAEVQLGIIPLPDGNIRVDSLRYCVPFCSRYSFESSVPGSKYQLEWEMGDERYSAASPLICFSAAGDHRLSARLLNERGCRNTIGRMIHAAAPPVADFSHEPLQPVEGLDEVIFVNKTPDIAPEGLNWHLLGGDTLEKGFSSVEWFSFRFAEAGVYPVALLVKDRWGCADTVVKAVKVLEDLNSYIPNVFTPNADGLNEIFRPVLRGVKGASLSVYDRWGEKIFESAEAGAGWDGTWRGKACMNGVYAWKIDLVLMNGSKKELTGRVTLLR